MSRGEETFFKSVEKPAEGKKSRRGGVKTMTSPDVRNMSRAGLAQTLKENKVLGGGNTKRVNSNPRFWSLQAKLLRQSSGCPTKLNPKRPIKGQGNDKQKHLV